MKPQSGLTRNQEMVMGTLIAAKTPLSAYTILDLLRGSSMRAPLQVYRALEKLREMGLVHRLESLNAFVACARNDCRRHGITAFAICGQCGQVSEFSDQELEARLDNLVALEKFDPDQTTIEIRGTCEDCSTAPAK